jgi:hypothetical protein
MIYFWICNVFGLVELYYTWVVLQGSWDDDEEEEEE